MWLESGRAGLPQGGVLGNATDLLDRINHSGQTTQSIAGPPSVWTVSLAVSNRCPVVYLPHQGHDRARLQHPQLQIRPQQFMAHHLPHPKRCLMQGIPLSRTLPTNGGETLPSFSTSSTPDSSSASNSFKSSTSQDR